MSHNMLRFGKKKHARDVLLSKISKSTLKVSLNATRIAGEWSNLNLNPCMCHLDVAKCRITLS